MLTPKMKTFLFGTEHVRVVAADAGPASAIRGDKGQIVGYKNFVEFTDGPLLPLAGVQVARATKHRFIKVRILASSEYLRNRKKG